MIKRITNGFIYWKCSTCYHHIGEVRSHNQWTIPPTRSISSSPIRRQGINERPFIHVLQKHYKLKWYSQQLENENVNLRGPLVEVWNERFPSVSDQAQNPNGDTRPHWLHQHPKPIFVCSENISTREITLRIYMYGCV